MLHMDGKMENAKAYLDRAAERLGAARDGLEKSTLACEALDRSIEELARFSETVYSIGWPDKKRALEAMESIAEATTILEHGSPIQCLVCNAMCDVDRAALLLWGDEWSVGGERDIPADNVMERVGADVCDIIGTVMLRDALSSSILDVPQTEDEALRLMEGAIGDICASRSVAHCFGCFQQNGVGTVEEALKSTGGINYHLGEAIMKLTRVLRYAYDRPLSND